jgi:hypothetical protein
MAVEVSPDGGVTWQPDGAVRLQGLRPVRPIVEVVPATATSTLYMNGFNVVFTKSTDHGGHWSAPVKTFGNVSWNDKPVIAMSDNASTCSVVQRPDRR